MEQLAVSELQQITAEIMSQKQLAGQSIFEIGKRLKYVKQHDLTHGKWLEWLDVIQIEPRMAQYFIQIHDELGTNTKSISHLGVTKLIELATAKPEVREQIIESGPDNMTVRQMQEFKRRAEQAEREARIAQEELASTQEQAASIMQRDRQLLEENERLKREKNPEPQVVVQTQTVVPEDYNELKQRVKQQDEQILAHTRHEVQQVNRYKVRDSIHDLTRTVGNFLNKVKLNVTEYEDDIISDSELFRTATGAADILRDAAKYLDSLVQAKTNARKDVVWDAEFVDAP